MLRRGFTGTIRGTAVAGRASANDYLQMLADAGIWVFIALRRFVTYFKKHVYN